jgi:tetratricopeptide (TPR) repeat protein
LKTVEVFNEHGDARELDEVRRVHPHDAATRFVIGVAYLYTTRIDKAIASFREGLRCKPEDAGAHYSLGSALFSNPPIVLAVRATPAAAACYLLLLPFLTAFLVAFLPGAPSGGLLLLSMSR